MFLASMKTLPRQPHLPSENPLPSNVADALAERIFAVVGADPTQSFESVQESMLMSLRQIGRNRSLGGGQQAVTVHWGVGSRDGAA